MSNPAVITLVNKNIGKNRFVRIEDNLGESIHVHFDNFRFDFTIEEFLSLESSLNKILNSLLDIEDLHIPDFDVHFLSVISHKLLDIKMVEHEVLDIQNLLIHSKGSYFKNSAKLTESIMFKALQGNKDEYIDFDQPNKFEESNLERLEAVAKYVKDNGGNIKPIVLFNRQNIIRDGQHRSACLLADGAQSISVVRLIFGDDRYDIPKYPIIRKILFWNLERLKNVYRSLRAHIGIKKKYVLYKFYLLRKRWN